MELTSTLQLAVLGSDVLLLIWAEGELVHNCQEMLLSTMGCGG